MPRTGFGSEFAGKSDDNLNAKNVIGDKAATGGDGAATGSYGTRGQNGNGKSGNGNQLDLSESELQNLVREVSKRVVEAVKNR